MDSTIYIKVNYNKEANKINNCSLNLIEDNEIINFGKHLHGQEFNNANLKSLFDTDLGQYIKNLNLLKEVKSTLFDVFIVKSKKTEKLYKLRIYYKNCFYIKNNCIYAETTNAGDGVLIHNGKEFTVEAIERLDNIGLPKI